MIRLNKNSLAALAAISCALSVLCSAALADQPWYPSNDGMGNKPKAFMIYQQAQQAYQMGDYRACINLCTQAISLDHGNKYVILLNAMALDATGETYEAMKKFRAAISLDGNFIPARNNYALFLRKQGKTEEAAHYFDDCIRTDPRYPDAYYHLGEIYQEKGDLNKAIDMYESATRLKPNYFEAQRDLGLAIYERATSGQGGDISDSLEKLLIAEKLVPDNPMIHYYLSQIYCANGKLDEGEAEVRIALMNDPKLAAAHYEFARLRYFRGDPDRTLVELKSAQDVGPVYTMSKKYPKVDPVKLEKLAAQCYEIKDELPEAIDMYKDVFAAQPKNVEMQNHIDELIKTAKANAKKKQKPLPYDPVEVEAVVRKGIGEVDRGEFDPGKASFERALELNPNCFGAIQNLGGLLEARGDLQGAIAQYQKAMTLKPKYDGLYYNLAYLLEKMNLPTDAGVMYYKFHELAGRYPYDPKHIVALQQEDIRQKIRAEEVKKRGY